MTPPEEELERLRAENSALNAQVKLLAQTEQRLFRSQRELDKQLVRMRSLTDFVLQASLDDTEDIVIQRILRLLRTLFYVDGAMAFRYVATEGAGHAWLDTGAVFAVDLPPALEEWMLTGDAVEMVDLGQCARDARVSALMDLAAARGLPREPDPDTYLAALTAQGRQCAVGVFIWKSAQLRRSVMSQPLDPAHTPFLHLVLEYLRRALDNLALAQALRRSRQSLVNVLDAAQAGIIAVNRKTFVITYANPAAAQIIGSSLRELVGQRCLDWLCQDEGGACPFAHGAHASSSFQTEIATADGRRIPVMRTVSNVRFDEEEHLLESFIDLSQLKEAEKERLALEDQLQQARKMESVGRLAGGVAHDFNNMLGVILGHAEMALEQVDPVLPLHADLEQIRKAAERSANLTRQLLAFARKQTVAPKVLNLNDTVAGMLKMLQRLIGEDINLDWKPSENPWPVKVDPSQIDQILANLCVNARDAIANVGKIIIQTGNRTFDEAYCNDCPEASSGDFVMLSVSDTGCGMDKETLSHVFEPFFTTKGVGKGTGLGLATVYGVIKQNSGFINAYSEPGKGTTFKIYLPRYTGKTEQSRAEEIRKPALRGHETILLAEDEAAILEITRNMLTRLGYTVLAAGTPGDAIRLAKECAGEIHLLLTDVIMPDMNGRDLANTIQALRPTIKRLFMSGHTANVITHHGVLDEDANFIQKPFSLRDLASKVREVLGND